jgi:hypothetical protein
MLRPVIDDPADRLRFVGHLESESWSSWLAQELRTRFGNPKGPEIPRVLGRTELGRTHAGASYEWQCRI